MESEVVLAKLPPCESKLLGVRSQHGASAEMMTRRFVRDSAPQLSCVQVDDVLQRKAVILQYRRERERKRKRRKTRATALNAEERRKLKVHQIKPQHQKYELFLPLHQLWTDYITDLCNGLKPDSNPQVLQQKLLKADFHGCVLTVVRSRCPSYVGSSGILVQELKHVFKIITKENQLKIIPKRNSVFSVEMGDFVTHIYGSKFEFRSSERSAKKFKTRGSIDL